MSSDCIYYKAAGRSLLAVETFRSAADRAKSEIESLCCEVGASRAIVVGSVVYGFVLDKDVPVPDFMRLKASGRRKDGTAAVVGRRTTVRGASIDERMQAVRVPTAERLYEGIMGVYPRFLEARGSRGMRVAYTHVIRFKSARCCVIAIDTDDGNVPLDAEPMKRSEFWALVEVAEASNAD